jgi:hypothetical protein
MRERIESIACLLKLRRTRTRHALIVCVRQQVFQLLLGQKKGIVVLVRAAGIANRSLISKFLQGLFYSRQQYIRGHSTTCIVQYAITKCVLYKYSIIIHKL